MRHKFRTLLAMIAIGLGVPAVAEELIVVVHPATKLAPKDFNLGKNLDDEGGLAVLTKKNPNVVEGKSVRETPSGRAFLIALETPKTFSIPKVQVGSQAKAQGGSKIASLKYNEMVVVEPYSLYFRTAAEAEPQLLGKGFVWGRAASIQSSGNGNTITYTLTGETAAELTEKVLRKEVMSIPRLLSHVVAENLINGKGKPNATGDSILTWARQVPPIFTPAMPDGFGKIKIDPRMKSPPTTLSMTFRPTRTVKGDDGAVAIEVEMWNRLPVRAFGMLRRSVGKAEAGLEEEYRKRLSAERAKAPDPLEWARKIGSPAASAITKSRASKFDLAPDEKFVAQFQVPKGVSTNPALFRDDEVTVELSALGEMVDLRIAKKPSKKAK